jgi:nitroreductase
MVRRYADRPVDAAAVSRMLENAVRAPNAGFSQGWAFLVLETRADVERFWACASPPDARPSSRWLSGMRSAPVVIVPMSHEQAYRDRYAEPDKASAGVGQEWPVPYWHVDTGMAALLILQTAVDEGLGACFFGIPGGQVPRFKAEFGVPDGFVPVGAITVGHRSEDAGAAGSPSRRARRPLGEVVHRGGW